MGSPAIVKIANRIVTLPRRTVIFR